MAKTLASPFVNSVVSQMKAEIESSLLLARAWGYRTAAVHLRKCGYTLDDALMILLGTRERNMR